MQSMQLHVGEPTILNGEWNEIRSSFYALSGRLQKHCKSIMIIDTMNGINPHHFSYNYARTQDAFNAIHCVRFSSPYQLWSNMSALEEMIRQKSIDAVIITSLSLPFTREDLEDVVPLLQQIMERIEHMSKCHNLVVVIGNSPSPEDAAERAHQFLLCKYPLLVV